MKTFIFFYRFINYNFCKIINFSSGMKNINEVTNEFLLYNFFYKLNNIINSNGRNKYKYDERK